LIRSASINTIEAGQGFGAPGGYTGTNLVIGVEIRLIKSSALAITFTINTTGTKNTMPPTIVDLKKLRSFFKAEFPNQ
jgi:hypothetical protein